MQKATIEEGKSEFIEAIKLPRGTLAITAGGYLVLKTARRLVFIGDGSGDNDDTDHGKSEYVKVRPLPKGSKVTLEVF